MLLQKINLTKEQALKLIPLIQEAQTFHKSYLRRMKKILQEQKEAFTEFKKEDLKNQGFSKEVERKTAHANYKGKELLKRFRQEINDIEKEVSEILTESQKELIKFIRRPQDVEKLLLGKYPRRQRRIGIPPIFKRIRNMSDAEFDRKKEQIAERLIEGAKKRRLKITKDKNKVIKALEKIRELSEDKLEKELPKILDSLREKTEKERLQEELRKTRREIAEERYGPRMSMLSYMLLYPELIPVLQKWLNLEKEGIQTQKDEAYEKNRKIVAQLEKEVKQIRNEINILNLVNGLCMSSHQIGHVIRVAKKSGELFADRKVKPDKNTAQKMIKLLTSVRDALLNDEDIPKQTIKDLLKLRREMFPKKGRKHKNIKNKIDALIDEIEEILFVTQKEVLFTYNRCLIPPKNLKDPIRVGQASNTGRPVRILERIRKIPDRRYKRNKEDIIEKMVSGAERRGGKFSDEEREKVKEKLEKIIEKVRNMDDAEFELNKDELAKELEFLDKLEQLESQLQKYQDKEGIIRRKIRSNFLDPNIVQVLKERLKIMKEFEIGKPVDLDKISPADNCKDGKCALEE